MVVFRAMCWGFSVLTHAYRGNFRPEITPIGLKCLFNMAVSISKTIM